MNKIIKIRIKSMTEHKALFDEIARNKENRANLSDENNKDILHYKIKKVDYNGSQGLYLTFTSNTTDSNLFIKRILKTEGLAIKFYTAATDSIINCFQNDKMKGGLK